jgi:hypothetical protein
MWWNSRVTAQLADSTKKKVPFGWLVCLKKISNILKLPENRISIDTVSA